MSNTYTKNDFVNRSSCFILPDFVVSSEASRLGERKRAGKCSRVWRYFHKSVDKVACRICRKVFKNHGTTNLQKHMLAVHPVQFQAADPELLDLDLTELKTEVDETKQEVELTNTAQIEIDGKTHNIAIDWVTDDKGQIEEGKSQELKLSRSLFIICKSIKKLIY